MFVCKFSFPVFEIILTCVHQECGPVFSFVVVFLSKLNIKLILAS